MHPALYFSLAVMGPAIVVGGLMAWDALRHAPEGYEDETGFRRVEGGRAAPLPALHATSMPQSDRKAV